MTVYVVMENHLDVARINGVFVSENLAAKQIEQLKSKTKYIKYYDWWIEKHEIFGE